jgi:dipeptidyl aminopeptidase/acylaminoacyl peptidase
VLFLAAMSQAAAAPPALDIYGSLPQTEAVELSDDGSMLALIKTDGNQRILSIETADEHPVARLLVGDAKLTGIEWAGSDYVVVYLHSTARLSMSVRHEQEFIQGVIVNAKDGSIKPLLRASGDYLPAIFGRHGIRKVEGRWFGYYGVIPTERSKDSGSNSGYFKQRFPDLYKIDLETGVATRVTRGAADSRGWVIGDDGRIVAESEYDPNGGDWKVFLPGSSDRPLASGNSRFGFRLAGLSRTPGTILVREGDANGSIMELHLDSGKTETFLPSGKAMQLIHSPRTHLLLGAVMVDDNDSIMFDPTLEHHIRSIAKAFAGDAVRLISSNADMSRIVLHVSGKSTAGTWQLVDFKSGKATPIADDYPKIPDAMIASGSMVDYRAADGLPLQGVLTLPPGAAARNLPLIVLPHWALDSRDWVHFEWFAQAFATRGYAVFQPNFRGSTGYGQAFRNAGFGQWGRKMQTDLSDGVAALAAKGIVDPKRVCIAGVSYGGYAAMAGVTLQHGIYRCAASYGGISDPSDMIYEMKAFDRGDSKHYNDPAMRFWLSYLGFDSPRDPGLAAVSPQQHAENADAPILLVYGDKDTVVPPKQSTDMASALKHAGKPVEVVALDGEDHWLSRSETRLRMLKAMIAFVEKNNPPDTLTH